MPYVQVPLGSAKAGGLLGIFRLSGFQLFLRGNSVNVLPWYRKEILIANDDLFMLLIAAV